MPLFNSEVKKEEVKATEKPKLGFIVVSKDFSGLGWAKRFKDEGHDAIMAVKPKDDEDKMSEFKTVGKGIVEVMDLDKAFSARSTYKDWYWIFDMNVYSDYAKKLKKEGYKVFGGQSISEQMEEDRDFASKLMDQFGIKSPPTQEFSSAQDGMAFLDANPDTAYVFKPDHPDANCYTYVPDSEKNDEANRELYVYLQALGDTGTYILQERIKGVESNFEVWFHEGKPFFAFCDIECKKKYNHDLGGLIGCSMSIDFQIPLECKAIQYTVAKIYPFYAKLKYTGFVDVNVIVCDNEDYYLESCNRFGYNSHPNLLFSVACGDVSDLLADFIDGKIDDFYDKFRYGFGASLTLRTDDPKKMTPLFIDKDVEKNFYMFDGIKQKDQYYTSGYSEEIGIITAHGYTIKEAAEEVLKVLDKVHFPLRSARTDLDKNDYHSAPLGRFDAMDSMGYFDKI